MRTSDVAGSGYVAAFVGWAVCHQNVDFLIGKGGNGGLRYVFGVGEAVLGRVVAVLVFFVGESPVVEFGLVFGCVELGECQYAVLLFFDVLDTWCVSDVFVVCHGSPTTMSHLRS